MSENTSTPGSGTSESIQSLGIPVITMELNAASVIANAVDTTLSNSGEAADAAVVGARFDGIDTTRPSMASTISLIVLVVPESYLMSSPVSP